MRAAVVGEQVRVTCSAGVVEAATGESLPQVAPRAAQAVQAVQVAKRAGRDRVVIG